MRATRWIVPGLVVLAVAPGLIARPSAIEQYEQVVGGIAPPAGQGRGATQPPPSQQQQGQAQKPPPPLVTTGLIVGRVIDADSGKPVAGATVQLSGGVPSGPPVAIQPGQPRPAPAIPAPPPRFLTDGEGRFAFRSLTRGNYTLVATKPGYADGAYGRFRPGGSSRSIQLTDAERVGEISIRVFKYAVISGTVLDELGEPVVSAQLRSYRRVLQAGRRVLTQFGSTTTDDRGQYRFSNLVPGEYVIALPMVSTSAPAGFTGDGRNLNLQLTGEVPGGSYYGFGGGRAVTPDGRFLLQSTGAFGSQAIGAQQDTAGRLLGYPTQYFQNSGTASQATTVKVVSGEERMSVDLVMRLVPTANISGMLFSPEGPASNFVLHLVPSDSDTMVFDPDVGTAVTDQTGAFMFLAIPAGQYVIQTTRMPEPQPPPPPPPPLGSTTRVEQSTDPSGRTIVTTTTVGANGTVMGVDRRTLAPPMLWTALPVVVGGANIDGVSLTLREGYKISGRVEFSGGGERPPAARLAQIPVSVEPADARQRTNYQQPGRVAPDGTFTVTGLLPGKYLVRIGGAPGGWTTQSVMAGGVDVSDMPLELADRDVTGVVVTFTDRIADLRGLVRGLKADAEPPAVIVFPGDPAAWKNFGSNPRRLRMSRASTNGNFAIGTLPSGEYLIVAIPDEYSSEWNDPGYLDQLSRVALRITLGEGEKKVQELEISNVRPPGSGAPAPLPAAIEAEIPDLREAHGPFVPEQTPPLPPVPPAAPAQARDRTTVDPVGAGAIAGVVVDEASGQPVRRARVSARMPEMRNDLQSVTDDQGRFSFGSLPPGPYTIVVSKPAYLTSYHGATRPNRGPGTPVPVKDGQAVSGIVVRMTRGGVISGMVLDQYGQPFSGGRLRLMQVQRRDGERTLTGASGSGTMTTDDRGIYRIYGLQPGQYVVGITPPTSGAGTTETRLLSDSEMRAALADLARRDATPATAQPASPAAGGQDSGRTIPPAPPGPRPDVPLSGRALGLAPVYYPGTVIDTDAGVVNLVAGQEITGIDFTLMYMPTSRLEGSVVLPDGQPAARAQLQLTTVTANSSSSTSVRMQGDGKFQAIGVAPGKYMLIARQTDAGGTPLANGMAPVPMQQGGAVYYAMQELLLNGDDVTGLMMTLAPTATLSGRVVFEGAAGPPPEVTTVRVSLEGFGPTSRISGSSRSIQADKSGEFRITGVTPGQYRLSASAQANSPIPLGWLVKNAALEGRDVYEQPFDVQPGQTFQPMVVTMSDQAAELTGTFTDAAGSPVTNLQIVLFPTDRTAWGSSSRRMRGPTRPNPDGTYRFGGIRPGEYFIAAVADLEPGDWGDPAFMEQLAAQASKLVFAPSEKKVQNFRTGG